MQIICDEVGAGQSLLLGCQYRLRFRLGYLLQQPLNGLCAGLVLETINYATGSEVQKRLAILFEMLVGIRSPVQGLDIFVVYANGSRCVFDGLFPILESDEAGGAVRVKDGVTLAEDSFPV